MRNSVTNHDKRALCARGPRELLPGLIKDQLVAFFPVSSTWEGGEPGREGCTIEMGFGSRELVRDSDVRKASIIIIVESIVLF